MNQVNVYSVPIFFILLILFIVGSLISDHYQRGYLFTSRTSNGTIFIERALERIPTCNAEDRRRQKALLYTLQEWTHLAYSHHIHYWISHRTLLGYISRQGFLPDEHSLDIAMMAEDISKILELRETNHTVEVHSQVLMNKNSHRPHTLSKEFDLIALHARLLNQKYNLSIQIWPVHLGYSKKYISSLLDYVTFDTWIISPIEWTFPLEPCVLSGIKVWCPAQSTKLITAIYGSTAINMLCINGSWIRSNK